MNHGPDRPHVALPSFADGLDYEAVIRETLAKAQRALCSTDATIVLREAFETKFGIYDHSNPQANRPLASLAHHWAEDNTLGSVLYERIEQFDEREIYSRFGLSLTEFLQLPTDYCKKIMEIAGRRLKEKANMTNTARSQLEEQLAGVRNKP